MLASREAMFSQIKCPSEGYGNSTEPIKHRYITQHWPLKPLFSDNSILINRKITVSTLIV